MAKEIDLREAGSLLRLTLRPIGKDAGNARNHSSANSGKAASRRGQNALHVLIVSALSLCGAAVAGQAQASCSGSSNQNLSAGDYGYSWSICNGAAGTDSKDEKDGAGGDSITITTEGTYATSAGVPPYSLPGAL